MTKTEFTRLCFFVEGLARALQKAEEENKRNTCGGFFSSGDVLKIPETEPLVLEAADLLVGNIDELHNQYRVQP